MNEQEREAALDRMLKGKRITVTGKVIKFDDMSTAQAVDLLRWALQVAEDLPDTIEEGKGSFVMPNWPSDDWKEYR